MSFVYNPRNLVYLKASIKDRNNAVGSEHSSAALLENATGHSRVACFKMGAQMSRLSVDEPLMRNIVAKASTELVTGE